MAEKPTYENPNQKINKARIIQKSIIPACFILLVTLSGFICPPTYAEKVVTQDDYQYKILTLNSYHKEFEWTDGQVSAARKILTSNLTNPELYIEYMDTKRIKNKEYFGLLYKTLWLKYHNVKLDAIIATDDNALNFLLKHRNELFGEVPVVFGGINGYSDTLLADRPLFTGLIEILDIKPTIDLALKLHPSTNKIVVVIDDTPTGKWIRKDIEETIPHYKDVRFEYLSGEEYTTEELVERLRALPKNNIVLMGVWLRDKAKKYISTHCGISLISSNSTVPVYGLFGNHLGNGIIGGKLLDSSIHGKVAAKMVVRILKGEKPHDIPVLIESANHFMFDYTQLNRWNISVSDLPEDSTVINIPFSLYEEYKYRIWLAIVTLLIFSVTIIILITNILMRNKAEKALRAEKEFSESITETANAIIVTFDADGAITSFNKFGEDLTGYKKKEIIGKNWINVFIPSTNKAEIQSVHESVTAQSDEEKIYQNYILLKDGEKRLINWNNSALINEKGETTGAIAIGIDITKRKNVEDDLRESEEKYRSMMDAMDDAAYICSPEYRIEYMNPAMVKRSSRDATGESCHNVIHGLDEKCSWCIHEKIMHGEIIKTEIISPKDDKPYHISNSPVFHADDSVSMLSVFRDMSEMKKMESQVQQSQKMESIGTLAGGIAHDFNNILFPIVGHSEMLLLDVPEDSPFKDGLNQIYTGALRASELVKQILTFSRQENTDLKLMKIQPIIKEALKLIRSTIPTTIEIKQDIQTDCGAVKADPTQIHQIVMNLATNAYHAMEETGGKMNIKLKKVELGEPDLFNPDIKPVTYARLSISDTGKGMNNELIEKIFDPFFTTKETGKGTGMGLSVVHGIVKNMDGTIKVYSRPDKGTKFHVYLPLAEEVKKKQTINVETSIQSGNEHILLVDDEKTIIEMEQNMLERLGYKVTSRSSSIEALEAFRAAPDKFDLIITDMAMPKMPGDKLSAELTKIRPNIPVLLCTGFSETMSEEKAVAMGIKGFLLKPIVMKNLSHTIREVLDKK